LYLPERVTPLRCWIAIGTAFFINGLGFSSWASRIPTIKNQLGLSEAMLGSVLLSLPLGSILASFISAQIVTRIGTKKSLPVALLVNGALYVLLGLAPNILTLALDLFLIGIFSNLISVSANTQAVGLEAVTERQVMASLHGLWSTAGFVGAAVGSIMLGFDISPKLHFCLIYLATIGGVALTYRWYLDSHGTPSGKRQVFIKPTATVLGLGFLAFSSMICEGAMFDWSGVYFQTVLAAPPSQIGLGYGAFMCAMASTRFVADRLTVKYGPRRVLTTCGLLVAAGLVLAITSPSVLTGIAGFLLVGAGTSAVVPLVFSQAGKVTDMPPSAAIAAASTIGVIGFLLGPPLIGWIAAASSLRWSFLVIAVLGLGIAAFGRRQFASKTGALNCW